jgi:hypothetical protein
LNRDPPKYTRAVSDAGMQVDSYGKSSNKVLIEMSESSSRGKSPVHTAPRGGLGPNLK